MDSDIKPGKIAGYAFLALIVIFALTWAIQGNDFFINKFFAPKQEAVRREVFENSKAFNQGMVQELENMQLEYVRSKDEKAKEAMASIILHRASGYNLEDPAVSADLRSFIQKLKSDQTGSGY
jgi:hypothetical protein